MKREELERITLYARRGTTQFTMEHGSFRYRYRLGRSVLRLTGRDGLLVDEKGARHGTVTMREENGLLRLSCHLDDPGWNVREICLPKEAGEHFYGCGEQFAAFDLTGQPRVRIWVAEHQNGRRIGKKLLKWKFFGARPGKPGDFRRLDQYESYYVQPTFVSSNKWFLHVDGSSYMEFSFNAPGEAHRDGDVYGLTVRLWEDAELVFGKAGDFPALSEKLSGLLGRIAPLPDWTGDGMILGIQRGPAEIDEKLAKCRAHGIPVAGVWCQDWCGCRRTDFGYQVMWNWQADETLYPHLREKIAAWRAQGVRFLGYINPFLALEKNLYKEAAAKGYCVKDHEGKDYLVTITTFPAAMIDLTNPDAYEWYKKVIRENMIDIGMGGWMADFGEYLPTDAVLFDGSDPMAVHNRWPAIWAKLNREAVQEAGREGEVFFFTRAGFTETIRYSTLMWNGDQHVDWSLDDGLASVIPATLSLAMSGFGVAHSDVGGYTTVMQMTRSRELFMRWAEMNAFSPLMRSHEGNQPDRSVQFDADEEMLEHLAGCVKWFVGLKPYLRALFDEQASRGLPVMRPLFYHYDEPEAYAEKYEYLLGRDVLVAPVIVEGAVTREVWLPGDRWIHLFSGKEYGGGRHTVDAPPGVPPVFVRRDAARFDELMGIV